MILRTAVPDDAETISENNLNMAMETEGRALDPDKSLRGVRAVIADRSKGFYLLAEEGAKIIGQVMITVEWSDWRNGEFWWVQSVYVQPEHRGKGILTHLFKEIELRSSRCEECVGIRLYVDEHNVIARRAYARLGLKESHYIMYERENVP